MKKLYKYLFMVVSAVALLPLMTACSDDESTDPYDVNYVYIYSPAETNGEMVYKGNGTFLTQIASERNLTPVRCTKPAPERLVAHFTIDGSLVDAYNKEHGTNYTFVKSAQLDNATLVIEQGKYISADSLKLKLTDMTEFQNGAENYILPIVMTSVEGGGISMSQTSKMFLTFTSTYKANKVYIGSGASTTVKLLDGKVNEPENPGRIYWNAMVSTEWVPDDDITVHLEIDNKLIDSYNAINGTDYKPMENVALETSVMHIKKGEYGPDETFALTFSDKMASVKVGENYIVPVVVSKVEGVGAGLSDRTTCYLTFNVMELPNAYITTSPTGTLIQDFTNWNVTVDGSAYGPWGGEWKSILEKASQIGYIQSHQQILVEAAEPTEISSMVLSYRGGYTYSGKASIETSLDGESFKKDELELPNSTAQFVSFRKPVKAKYIRITFADGYFSSYYGAILNRLRICTPSTEE